MSPFVVDTSSQAAIYLRHIRPLAVSQPAILGMADPLGLFLFRGTRL